MADELQRHTLGNDASANLLFVSILYRRPEETHNSSGLIQLTDGVRTSKRITSHMYLSGTKRFALHTHRALMKKKKKRKQLPADIQRTLIKNLGAAEYVGSIGVGTRHRPEQCRTSRTAGKTSVVKQPFEEKGELDADDCGVDRPQATFQSVVFDTGSTNIWMASTLCQEGPCTNADRHRYNHSESATYRDPVEATELEVNFGTARLRGPLGVEHFRIGPFVVQNQTFALIAEETGASFRSLPLEGIIGLGFPSMSARNMTPFFDSIIAQKVLKRNMFCFYLASTGDSLLDDGRSDATAGAILWGGYDTSLFSGSLKWFPVTKAHYWAIDLLEFYVGDEKFPVTHSHADSGVGSTMLIGAKPAYLIFDTGTTYYAAQGALYENLARSLPPGHCHNISHYPPLTYRLKDINGAIQDIVLTQEDYMTTDESGYCEMAFMEVGPPANYGPAMLMGELFMRKYFLAFDRGNGSNGDARIGIAKSRNQSSKAFIPKLEDRTF